MVCLVFWKYVFCASDVFVALACLIFFFAILFEKWKGPLKLQRLTAMSYPGFEHGFPARETKFLQLFLWPGEILALDIILMSRDGTI